jgi:hypothetical protein
LKMNSIIVCRTSNETQLSSRLRQMIEFTWWNQHLTICKYTVQYEFIHRSVNEWMNENQQIRVSCVYVYPT